MTGLPWFKCYPRDFNEGMERLTLEERGAYVTILNLIYSRGGPIPEDVWWITSKLGCTKRTWVKIRAALIIKGKIFALSYNGEDCLMNARAAEELEKHAETSRKYSEAGKKGGQNSRPKAGKNNDLAEAGLSDGLSRAEAIQISEPEPEATTTDAGADWRGMLEQAKEAAGDMADMTRPAMHHVADLRALVEPKSGEPCTWDEVLTAVGMTAMRQRTKGRPITSWAWVRDDALNLRDKRLTAANPAVAEVVHLRATGPPNITDRIAAERKESERIAFEMLDARHGRTN